MARGNQAIKGGAEASARLVRQLKTAGHKTVPRLESRGREVVPEHVSSGGHRKGMRDEPLVPRSNQVAPSALIRVSIAFRTTR